MSFNISGNTGKANSVVYYLGTAFGNVTADGSGNYSITGLVNGIYLVAPASLSNAAVPVHQIVLVAGNNVTGINFTATPVFSVVDSRLAPNAEVDVAGTDTYTVQTASNPGLPVDSRAGGQSIDSRTSIPVNCRNTPH